MQNRKVKLIPQNRSQLGLESAIRLHECGIASNRGSERRGEYVPGPCTHTARQAMKDGSTQSRLSNRKGENA